MNPAKVDLDSITAPVARELRLLETELRRIFSSRITLISAIGRHLVAVKGKRIRPALVLLCAKIGSPDLSDAVKVGAAIEIVHTATLLHDDSIDRSHLRRGLPTVNKLWNDQVSVIMGDHLFCTAFRLLHDAGLFEVASILSEGSDSMTFGEMYQMDLRGRYDITEETYLDMIEHKTASLFQSACEAGARLGGLGKGETARLRRYGKAIGTAFQIVDDMLDYVGDTGVMGKPVGNDLRDGRVTLPLIVALRNCSPRDRTVISRLVRSGPIGHADWERIVSLVESNHGITYSQETASRLAAEARGAAEGLRPGEARTSLMELADRIVSRHG